MAKNTQRVGVPAISAAKRFPIRKSVKEHAAAETGEVPAKQYEPTENEKVALAKFNRRLAKRLPMPS